MLPSAATQAHAYLNLKSTSLPSIWKLCDSNCSLLFTKKDATIFNSDKTPVLNGRSSISDGLWDVTIETSYPEPPFTETINQHANYILRLDKTKSELASHLHAASGCLTKSNFIQAINNGNFITWPGITLKIISKQLPFSLPTFKGHLKQDQQNTRSTKKISTTEKPAAESLPTQYSKTQAYFFIARKESGTTYSELTGRYPIISSPGNQYIVICCNYDTNGIQATPTKTHNYAEIRDSTMSMLNALLQVYINPIFTFLIMGNQEQYQVPSGTPAPSYAKCSRTCHSNIQGTFHHMSLCSWSRISSKIVGLFPTSNSFDSTSALQLPLQSKIISTCSSPWHIWLQQNNYGTTWNQSPSPW